MTIADTVDGLCLTRSGEGHRLGSQAQEQLLWSTPASLLGKNRQSQGAKGEPAASFLAGGEGQEQDVSQSP